MKPSYESLFGLYRPDRRDTARVLSRLQERGFDTSAIEEGLFAMVGGRPEPGDDAVNDEMEDGEVLVPLGEVLAGMRSEIETEEVGHGWAEQAAAIAAEGE